VTFLPDGLQFATFFSPDVFEICLQAIGIQIWTISITEGTKRTDGSRLWKRCLIGAGRKLDRDRLLEKIFTADPTLISTT